MELVLRRAGPVVPRWVWSAALGAICYAAIGQLWLWLQLRSYGTFAGRDAATLWSTFEWAYRAVWFLTALIPALERRPDNAQRAALAAGLALLTGLILHLWLREALWPILDDGCWTHSSPYTEFTDLVCIDMLPERSFFPYGFVFGFVTPLVTWGAGLALVVGSAIAALRILRRRVSAHVGV